MNEETKDALALLALPEWLHRLKEARKQREEEEWENNPLNVKRYEASDTMQESPTGEMVRYEDHIKAVEHLKEQISRAYNDGKADGAPEYSWRL